MFRPTDERREYQGPRDTGMRGNVTPSALLGRQSVLKWDGFPFICFMLHGRMT